MQGLAINDQITVEGGIACQIDVGGIVVICDAARTVPRRIGYVGVAGVIACCDAAAADAVGVACLRGDALVGGLHRGHLGFIRVGCDIFQAAPHPRVGLPGSPPAAPVLAVPAVPAALPRRPRHRRIPPQAAGSTPASVPAGSQIVVFHVPLSFLVILSSFPRPLFFYPFRGEFR